jgi:hypothetical protein
MNIVMILFSLNIHRYCYDAGYKTEMDIVFNQKIPELFVLINNAAVQLLGRC